MEIRIFMLVFFLAGCSNQNTTNWLDEFSPTQTERKSGYILFYFDPSRDCLSCLDGLQYFNVLQKTYPEIGFFAVLRGQQIEFEQFRDELIASNISTSMAWDKQSVLQDRFHLEDGPYVLFLNETGRAVSVRKAHYSIPLNRRTFTQWVEQL